MKTLFVIDSMASGGAQRILLNVVQSFRKNNIDVTVLLYRPKENFFLNNLESINANVIQIKRRRDGFSLSVLIAIIRLYWLGHNRIFSFQPTANIYCAMAKIFAPRTQVFCCEFSITNVWTNKKKRFIANIANVFASKIICNSITQKGYLSSFFTLREKTIVAWNGYDLANFEKRDYVPEKFHKLTVIGRIAYPKNGVNFIKGLQCFFEKTGRTLAVEWVGRRDFDRRSVEMYEEMIKLLNRYPALKNSWTWRGEVENVNQVYIDTDCIILPSIFEGLPNVICEAMIIGCPVLASNVSDIPIILGKDSRGILFEPLVPETIAEALIKFDTMKSRDKTAMIYKARKYAHENFDLGRMTATYKGLL